jgi:hypothetical protein
MKKIAVDKARVRLDKASGALKRVEASRTFPDFQSAWTDFLVALNSIVFVLEKGARGNPQSQQWYGGKKTFGRKDPLLRYLHQARNADEHGLEPVAERMPAQTFIGAPGQSVNVKSLIVDDNGNINAQFEPVNGVLPTIKFVPPHAVLIAVSDDRYGETHDPPKSHLGRPLLSTSPAAIAKAALEYYSSLIDEAELMIR